MISARFGRTAARFAGTGGSSGAISASCKVISENSAGTFAKAPHAMRSSKTFVRSGRISESWAGTGESYVAIVENFAGISVTCGVTSVTGIRVHAPGIKPVYAKRSRQE